MDTDEEYKELVTTIASYIAANGIMNWNVPDLAKHLIEKGWHK